MFLEKEAKASAKRTRDPKPGKTKGEERREPSQVPDGCAAQEDIPQRQR